MAKIAVLLKANLPDFKGEANLFLIDPPMTYKKYDDSGEYTMMTTKYVIVSKVFAYSGPETYIFPAKADGTVKDWGELKGSMKGEWGINEVLQELGYEVSAN